MMQAGSFGFFLGSQRAKPFSPTCPGE